MNSVVDAYLRFIDTINEYVGKVGSLIVLIIMLFVVIEVFARYVLNSPTIWATEMNEMLLCAYAALAGGYSLLHNAHVSVEMVQERMSRKMQAVVNLFTYLFGIAFLAVLIQMSWENAIEAWEYSEHSETLFAPSLFPVKISIPIGGVLFLLQLTAHYIREIRVLLGTKDTENKETN